MKVCDTGNECGPMRIETKKYKKYSSILKIKQSIKNPAGFYFAQRCYRKRNSKLKFKKSYFRRCYTGLNIKDE